MPGPTIWAMRNDTWITYVRTVIGHDTQTRAGKRTLLGQTTIGRWLNGAKAPTEAAKVAAFAQGYGRNVLEAFVAAGMLTEEEAGRGLPASSVWFLRSLSEPADELGAVAEPGDLEESGDQTP